MFAAASLTGHLHRDRPSSSKPPTRERPSSSTSPARPTWSPRSPRAPPPTCSPRRTRRTWPRLTDADLVDGEPVDFATNMLEIAVPPGNPAGIDAFADLAAPGREARDLRTRGAVRCRHRKVEAASGVTLAPVSEESSVTDVLGKVTSGEADAGLVYVTDVIAAGDAVEGIEFAESAEAVNTYPIAALTGAEAPTLRAGVRRVRDRRGGQAVLAAAGFGRAVACRMSGQAPFAGVPRWVVRRRRWSARCSCSCRSWRCSPGRLGRVHPAGHLGVLARRALAEPAHLDRRHRAVHRARRADGARPRAHARSRPEDRCARSCCCRSCCRPSSAASRCSTRSVGAGCSGRRWRCSASQIAFSTTAVVMAQTFVALPFLVLSLEGALRTVGTRYEAVGRDPRRPAHDGAAADHPAARAARR